MRVAREKAGNLAAAAFGIACGVALFLAPAFLMGARGLPFGSLIAWAMIWSPGSLILFDAHFTPRVARLLLTLAIHSVGLAFMFSPIFMLGRLAAQG